ncbi:MAG: BrnT family toxin [Endozoicomonas sp.]|uniref:BrnT family toxin n=1 Tax=Endozoicomonas sp. TaxID=1892382 RepID=UPI003D9AD862
MEFEWDEKKNEANWIKHRVDFSDALYVFLDDSRIEREDIRNHYGETRYQTMGMTEQGVLFVIFTERSNDTIRLISARKANKQERKWYERGYFRSLAAG